MTEELTDAQIVAMTKEDWTFLRYRDEDAWLKAILRSEYLEPFANGRTRKAPELKPQPVTPAVRYTTLEEITEKFYTVQETKDLVKKSRDHLWNNLANEISKKVVIPLRTSITALEEDKAKLIVQVEALEAKIASMADAGLVAGLIQAKNEQRSEIDRLKQQLSANQKHCQSLEKKLGVPR